MDEVRHEISRIRRERGLSQRQLAELSGVDRPALNQIEGGHRSPTIDTLGKLASGLGVEVADFFPKAQPDLFSGAVKGPDPAVWGPDEERPGPEAATPAPGGDRIHAVVEGDTVTITRTRLAVILRAVEAHELSAAEAVREIVRAA
jgi:transcriptional regulator with XRE-family HTH domain